MTGEFPVASLQFPVIVSPQRLGTGNWALETSCQLTQHPPILPLDRVQQIDLQSLGQHVPGVGFDLEVVGEPGTTCEIEDLAHIVLRRSESFVIVRKERHVEMYAP